MLEEHTKMLERADYLDNFEGDYDGSLNLIRSVIANLQQAPEIASDTLGDLHLKEISLLRRLARYSEAHRAIGAFEDALTEARLSQATSARFLSERGKYHNCFVNYKDAIADLYRAMKLALKSSETDPIDVQSIEAALSVAIKDSGDRRKASKAAKQSLGRVGNFDRTQRIGHQLEARLDAAKIMLLGDRPQDGVAQARQVLTWANNLVSEKHPVRAMALYRVGKSDKIDLTATQRRQHISEAADLLQKRLSNEHPLLADVLLDLPAYLRPIGEYEEAEQCISKAARIRANCFGKEHPLYAEVLGYWGTQKRTAGDYSTAEKMHAEGLRLRTAHYGREHPSTAISLNQIAGDKINVGDLAEVERLRSECLKIREKTLGPRHPQTLATKSSLAFLFRITGRIEKGLELAHEVLEAREEIYSSEHPIYAESLNSLGLHMRGAGKQIQALDYFKRALEIRLKLSGENSRTTALAHRNLASVYIDLNALDEAEHHVTRANHILSHSPGPRNLAQAFTLLVDARLKFARGDRDAADLSFSDAVDLVHQVYGEKSWRYWDFSRWHIEFLVEAGRYQQAIDKGQTIIRLAKSAQSAPSTVLSKVQRHVSKAHFEMGEFTTCIELASAARETICMSFGDFHPDNALLLTLVGKAHIQLGNQTTGFESLRAAVSVEEQIISETVGAGSESIRVSFLETVWDTPDLIFSLAAEGLKEDGLVPFALETLLRRKGLGLEARAGQRDAFLTKKYPMAEVSLRELRGLRDKVTQMTLNNVVQSHEHGLETPAKIRDRIDLIERELAKTVEEISIERRMRKVTVDELLARLPPETTILEYIRYRFWDHKAPPSTASDNKERYLCFVASADFLGDPEIHAVDLGDAVEIDDAIRIYRDAIMSGRSADRLVRLERAQSEQVDLIEQNLAGQRVRELVFDPLFSGAEPTRQLLISTDGRLSELPFDALPARTGDKVLFDDHEITFVTTSRDILAWGRLRSADRQSTPKVVADPDFALLELGEQPAVALPDANRDAYQAFAPLEHTKEEGELVADLLSCERVTGRNATESWVKQQKSPRILHLATHGFFVEANTDKSTASNSALRAMAQVDDNASDRMYLMRSIKNPLLRSGLALAGAERWRRGEALPDEFEDGLLTAEDVANLDLADTELVVLSACETALGEPRRGEGVFGLQRAFSIAGAKTMIMSLWAVHDQVTKELMTHFYGYLDEDPSTPARALRRSQEDIRKVYPSPFYWAAFVLHGER